MPRTVSAEVLDHLAPDDPEARHSRQDLVRVHRAMGTRAITWRAWQHLLAPHRTAAPLRVLELGAGDGSLLLGVARSLAPSWPPVRLTLLDRQDIVSRATLAGFAELGWAVKVQVADALAWAERPEGETRRWDLVTTALFLHHFQGADFDRLLAAVAARADRFFACEPRRSWLPLAASHLVGVIGANAVTREDAVLSVHAGFRDHEIGARWPRCGVDWQTRECAEGPFSHCFSARRAGLA